MLFIIPPSLRDRLLQELHEEHPGIVAMKAFVQSFVWWPNLDAEVELTVKSCAVSSSTKSNPPVYHCTDGGVLLRCGKDTHRLCREGWQLLPWAEGQPVQVDWGGRQRSPTAQSTVDQLRMWFALYGLLEESVSDNGLQFFPAVRAFP